MAKGISLHIGLNFVDPNHYGGWDGELSAAEYDAKDMHNICASTGFKSSKVLREQATLSNVTSKIKEASKILVSGDFFCISYSGHGGQLPDLNSDEDDGQDETWCLYDGQLVDDELASLWSLFKPNVRILVVSDSCHSGTVAKTVRFENYSTLQNKTKFMPPSVASRTYYNNQEFYKKKLSLAKNTNPILANLKLLSGCQDNQSSYDGTFNGQFTDRLKQVWNGGKFNNNYHTFHKNIMALLPDYQTPNLLNVGELNSEFDNQKPFKI
jgi:hypothetical protein